jgi:hypothetical protein
VIDGVQFFFNVSLRVIELCFALMAINDGIMNNSAPAYPYVQRKILCAWLETHRDLFSARTVDEEQSQIASFSLSSNVKTAIPSDPSDEIKAEYGHWLRRAIEAGAEGPLLSCSSHTQRIESRLRRDKSHY